MSRYAIEPGGVASVLTQVDGRLDELRSADTAVVQAAEAALSAVGSSAARPGLERLLDDFRSVVPTLHDAIARAHVAATSATQAYIDADDEMARRIPAPGRPGIPQ